MDPDDVARVRALLDESDRVDATRVHLVSEGGRFVLSGFVATPEEAGVAAMIAERELPAVVNALVVDPGLREGLERPADTERTVPAENEILVGDPDMLSGPESQITTDLERSLEENEPLDPPDEPHFGLTAVEQRGGASDLVIDAGLAGADLSDDEDADEADREDDELPAAADLTAQDLAEAAGGHGVPALDPDRAAPPAEAQPDPSGREPLGGAPSEAAEADRFPEPVPGAAPGDGATGEGTAGGGGLSGVAATETGAIETDTASADPTRGGSGGTMTDLGTERGPGVAEDPPLREDVDRHD
jgi:hypothetical protein